MQDDFDSGMGIPDDELGGGAAEGDMGDAAGHGGESEMEGESGAAAAAAARAAAHAPASRRARARAAAHGRPQKPAAAARPRRRRPAAPGSRRARPAAGKRRRRAAPAARPAAKSKAKRSPPPAAGARRSAERRSRRLHYRSAMNETSTGDRRIRVGISACLLGENVRFDGGHKRDSFLTDTLGRFVEWVPICPEVECGLRHAARTDAAGAQRRRRATDHRQLGPRRHLHARAVRGSPRRATGRRRACAASC